MKETPSPYDVWATEETLKLVEEATAQRFTPAVGRCQEQPAPTADQSGAFCPNFRCVQPFVRHFSKSGQFAFGLPEKVEPDRITTIGIEHPSKL
jgi:hypothetical protein